MDGSALPRCNQESYYGSFQGGSNRARCPADQVVNPSNVFQVIANVDLRKATQYSEALLLGDDPDQARIAAIILREQLQRRDDEPRLYRLLARASALSGDDFNASLALAEYYFRSGEVTEALQQLDMVIARQDLSYYQRSSTDARLEEMRVIASQFDHSEAD